MGKTTGFREFIRKIEGYRDVHDRILDYDEVFTDKHRLDLLSDQGARCMDCGVAFCQSHDGCPIDNLIPEWNDLVYQNRWHDAYIRLYETNNFPEFTGRVCPAPCEGACVLEINESAVTIKNIEMAIADKAFDEGWIKSNLPGYRSGKKVAVVGSGPAGLAAADELNKKGHHVVVFERDDRIGGLLMYGIPNMKLDKKIVNRRLNLLRDEGIEFVVNADVGRNVSFAKLRSDFDAILLAVGATKARTLGIKNADAKGIHLAMEYLMSNTKSLLDTGLPEHSHLSANCKNVIVIGGGDTGTDCIATALRQGAKSIVNFELMSKPTNIRNENNPWPEWPLIYRVDYGHEESQYAFGKDARVYCVMTKAFIKDDKGRVSAIKTVQVDFSNGLKELANSEKIWRADLVLLSLGFISPEHYVSDVAHINLDDKRNYQAYYGDYRTNQEGIFVAGDCRRGQSLVVWAINEGRSVAEKIDIYLRT